MEDHRDTYFKLDKKRPTIYMLLSYSEIHLPVGSIRREHGTLNIEQSSIPSTSLLGVPDSRKNSLLLHRNYLNYRMFNVVFFHAEDYLSCTGTRTTVQIEGHFSSFTSLQPPSPLRGLYRKSITISMFVPGPTIIPTSAKNTLMFGYFCSGGNVVGHQLALGPRAWQDVCVLTSYYTQLQTEYENTQGSCPEKIIA